jgi:Carboxypeptidase regulatory-like domain/TonB dependent receptor
MKQATGLMKWSSCIVLMGPMLFYFAPTRLSAQYTTASLGGIVVDTSGSVVPGATVTAEQVATRFTRTVTSGPDGTFLIPSLPVGNYEVDVGKTGFAHYVQSGITLTVDQSATIRVVLRVGAVSTRVQVSSQAPLVTTSVASVGDVVTQRPIVDLPLNGREPQQLVFLLPGTVDYSAEVCLVNCQGGVYPGEQEGVINGGGPGGVNYQLDGGNFNDTYMNANLPFPNPDAIQEFSVENNNLSAEYSDSSSAVVNIVTKSGTNQIHGDAFEFVRNGDLNARNFFAPVQDTLKRNQFGGTFGGAIIKDKLFYFGTIQYTPVVSTSFGQVAFVPTAAERAGDFSALSTPLINPTTGSPFLNNQIPASLLSAPAEYLLRHIPEPNGPNGELTYIGPPTVQNDLQWMPKIDYVQGKHHLSGHFFWTRFSQVPNTAAGEQDLLAVCGDGNRVTVKDLAVNDSYSLTSYLLLDTWFGWDSQTGGSLSGAPFGFPQAGVQIAAPTPPELSLGVPGYFSIATNHNGLFNRGDWTGRENVTLMKGSHELEFGGQIIHLTNNINNTYTMSGSFCFSAALSGNNLADFMLGRASSFLQGGGEFKAFEGNLPSLYVEDNWRVSKRLTLNMGLRWDPYFPFQETAGRVVCYQPGKKSTRYPNAPLGMLFGGTNHDASCPQAGMYSNLANFGPRVGFAYRLTNDSKTSLRGGAGIYYVPPMTTQFNAYADTAPFAPEFTLTDVSFTNPYASAGLVNPFPAEYGPTIPGPNAMFTLPVSIRWYFPLDWRLPEVDAWNVTLERQLGSSLLLRAAYVGNEGTYLSNGSEGYLETNPAVYIPGVGLNGQPLSTQANIQQRRINPNFGSIGLYTSSTNSSYNALQVSAEKRLSHGIQLMSSYTWSKAFDDYPYEGNEYSNPFDMEFDYGLSGYDTAGIFRFSGTWSLPNVGRGGLVGHLLNGWEPTWIASWQSGFPFSISSGVDNSLTGVGNDRADFMGTSLSQASLDPNRPHGQLISEYFNTSVFAPNAIGTFGNISKSILLGPGLFDTDLAMVKDTPITERITMQFRAEFFNVFNNVNFAAPGNTLGTASFGAITSTSGASNGGQRILQFALKLLF